MSALANPVERDYFFFLLALSLFFIDNLELENQADVMTLGVLFDLIVL